MTASSISPKKAGQIAKKAAETVLTQANTPEMLPGLTGQRVDDLWPMRRADLKKRARNIDIRHHKALVEQALQPLTAGNWQTGSCVLSFMSLFTNYCLTTAHLASLGLGLLLTPRAPQCGRGCPAVRCWKEIIIMKSGNRKCRFPWVPELQSTYFRSRSRCCVPVFGVHHHVLWWSERPNNFEIMGWCVRHARTQRLVAWYVCIQIADCVEPRDARNDSGDPLSVAQMLQSGMQGGGPAPVLALFCLSLLRLGMPEGSFSRTQGSM